jgi:hypothetical protein
MSPETINTISILSGVFSISISVIAMVLSIIFYFASRKTESNVSVSLTKIEAQTEALQKLSGRQIDKLMKHAFEGTAQLSNNDAMMQLMSTMSQIPLTITTILKQPTENRDNDESILLYSALYFYTAQTNYWSQFYLPKANEFDPENENHAHTKRIVDLSHEDFTKVANWLSECDPNKLINNPLYSYLEVTRDTWQHSVKTSSEVFVANSRY